MEIDEEELQKENMDEEEMDEEEMDEEEEHVEMDDRGRMKDLAPVSHWQGKREREGTCYNFRQSTTAPPLISNITCLPLISTAHNFASTLPPPKCTSHCCMAQSAADFKFATISCN